jgi:hypothetical protein
VSGLATIGLVGLPDVASIVALLPYLLPLLVLRGAVAVRPPPAIFAASTWPAACALCPSPR